MRFGAISANYDKMIALAVLLGLLGSLFYLALRVGTLPATHKQFRDAVDSMRPVKEFVAEEDVSVFTNAEGMIGNPWRMDAASWTNRLFIPETRVWCEDCKMPIAIGVVTNLSNCTFCGKKQQKPTSEREDFDGDGDGIPDQVERLYGLDPKNKADAHEDLDRDGFDNLTEYLAKTRMDDVGVFPPIIHLLKLDRLQVIPFKLLFMNRIKLPDGQYKFGLNTRAAEGANTYFARTNDYASPLYKKEGFLITKYQEKSVMVTNGPVAGPADASILTLAKGSKAIDLQFNREGIIDDLIAHLVFELDNTRMAVRADDTIVLKTLKYKVISIDRATETVRIRSLQDDSESVVRKSVATTAEQPSAAVEQERKDSAPEKE